MNIKARPVLQMRTLISARNLIKERLKDQGIKVSNINAADFTIAAQLFLSRARFMPEIWWRRKL